ncbi:hypothetical protein N9H97_03140 [Gammaproteobacteria bacterium]|nr:hypothetical protein [Gammaproteobacteria bacterium]
MRLLGRNSLIFSVIFLVGCASKPLDLQEQPSNPYAQHGVEGYMGTVMASCLATPSPMPPIRKSKNGPLSQSDTYFDCVDREILKKKSGIKKAKNRFTLFFSSVFLP